MKYVGNFVLAVALMFLSMYTLQALWGWFVVPLGVPALTLAHAYGISVLALFFKFKAKDRKDEPKEGDYSFAEKCFGSMAVLGLILLMGKIASLFM